MWTVFTECTVNAKKNPCTARQNCTCLLIYIVYHQDDLSTKPYKDKKLPICTGSIVVLIQCNRVSLLAKLTMSYIRLISFLANHLILLCKCTTSLITMSILRFSSVQQNGENWCAQHALIKHRNTTASTKPAQYYMKHNVKTGLAAYISFHLILDTRQQHPSTQTSFICWITKAQPTSKQAASCTPTLPGAMMRLRRVWNRWRLRGRALTSERLRYFGPAPYSGDGSVRRTERRGASTKHNERSTTGSRWCLQVHPPVFLHSHRVKRATASRYLLDKTSTLWTLLVEKN